MNELQIFNSPEFGDIRTVTIDNETYFVGKDVATALGYANPKNAVPIIPYVLCFKIIAAVLGINFKLPSIANFSAFSGVITYNPFGLL